MQPTGNKLVFYCCCLFIFVFLFVCWFFFLGLHHDFMLTFIEFLQGTSKLGHFRLKDDSQSSSLGPGSYFKKRDEQKEAPPLTGMFVLGSI